jgi:hypothetical protein
MKSLCSLSIRVDTFMLAGAHKAAGRRIIRYK